MLAFGRLLSSEHILNYSKTQSCANVFRDRNPYISLFRIVFNIPINILYKMKTVKKSSKRKNIEIFSGKTHTTRFIAVQIYIINNVYVVYRLATKYGFFL